MDTDSSTSTFVRADSSNLPKVDVSMIVTFLKTSDHHNIAEIRGAKILMSSRDSYLETAVGYVEVKRDGGSCILKARVVPEHRITSQTYSVTVKVDESNEIIEDTACDSCPAAAGGCKHTIVLLYWMEKRSSEPSTTSVQCYWRKPALANAQKNIIEAKDVFPTNQETKLEKPNKDIIDRFLKACKGRNCQEALIRKYLAPKRDLTYFCIYNLLLECYQTDPAIEYTCFKNFCRDQFSEKIKEQIEKNTSNQTESILWKTIRQGRITASKLYAVSACNTGNGSLVQEILGGYKCPETKAMQRGKRLEDVILKKLQATLNLEIKKAGFFICDGIFGASPDGICQNYVVEIKCPTSNKAKKNYINNNTISNQCMGQVQLQMHCTNRRKCLFCVADPNYENNGKLTLMWIDYEEGLIQKLMDKAEQFYIENIFPKILRSVKKQ